MSDLQVRGPLFGGTGTPSPFTADITGAQRVTDTHGRFSEAATRGYLFSGGMTITSINGAAFTTATLTASATPIIGLWNPVGSGKNLSVLQARVQLIATAVTTFTGPGPLMWCVSANQSAISTGITPFSRFSLAQSGSSAKVFAATLLTGLSGNLVVMEPSGLLTWSNNFSNALTAAGQGTANPGSTDNIDGGIILQPGSILALLGTTTPVSVSAASSILWEELPIYT